MFLYDYYYLLLYIFVVNSSLLQNHHHHHKRSISECELSPHNTSQSPSYHTDDDNHQTLLFNDGHNHHHHSLPRPRSNNNGQNRDLNLAINDSNMQTLFTNSSKVNIFDPIDERMLETYFNNHSWNNE